MFSKFRNVTTYEVSYVVLFCSVLSFLFCSVLFFSVSFFLFLLNLAHRFVYVVYMPCTDMYLLMYYRR